MKFTETECSTYSFALALTPQANNHHLVDTATLQRLALLLGNLGIGVVILWRQRKCSTECRWLANYNCCYCHFRSPLLQSCTTGGGQYCKQLKWTHTHTGLLSEQKNERTGRRKRKEKKDREIEKQCRSNENWKENSMVKSSKKSQKRKIERE